METYKFNYIIKNIHKVKAFDALYDFFYRRIVFHLKYIYGDALAQEVAQDFFLQLIHKENIGSEYIEYPASWVYKCCENLAKKKLAKEKNERISAPELLLEYEQQFEIEVYGDLYDTIKSLEGDSQKIIRMYYWEGYNFKEISAIMHIKAGTIRQKHSRALKKIGKNLTDV